MISRKRALKYIMNCDRVITLEFIKRDGHTKRFMRCRYGVRPPDYVESDKKRPYNPDYHNLVTVFDCDVWEFRNFPIEGLLRIKMGETARTELWHWIEPKPRRRKKK